VRGQGLFLGFEFVNNPSEKKVLPQAASYLSNRMRYYGILTSTDGPDENVIKIKPPICFSNRQADSFLNRLDQILGEDFIRQYQD
jgi:4-aminobutyrate aminotransferase-like enzyme